MSVSTPTPAEVAAAPGGAKGPSPSRPPVAGTPRRSLRIARRVGARLLGALAVLWAAATFVFFVQALLPGSRATLLLNEASGQQQSYSKAQLLPVEKEYGFNKPLIVQYLDYIGGLAHGNFGTSYTQHQPVLTIISREVGPTLVLTGAALAFAWVIALALTIATAKRGRFVSALGSGFEIVTAGLPYYWLGVILLVVFAIDLKVFPVQGGTSLAGLVLPALTLGIPLAGFIGQVTRDEFEKVLDQPFVTSARARGMGDLGVRLQHVLRHAVLPAVTLSGWALGALISGAVIVESVFARPGIGNMLVTAAESRDVPLVSGVVMLVAVVYVLANLLVDLAYVAIDPRLSGA
ncbi:MAG TPA: ABC transporter permease [Solirubrobacteraceae bacterium]|nr:ABC transporter permease [Solirubrobacteraceae bacterium]